MKKYLNSFICAVLLVTCLLSLSGCFNKGTKVANNGKYNLGTWKKSTYSNTLLGVKYEMPSGWEKSTADEILLSMNIDAQNTKDEEKIEKELSNRDNVSYLMAREPKTGNNVTIQRVKVSDNIKDEKNYIESIKTMYKNSTDNKYEVGKDGKTTLAGKKYYTVDVKITMNDIVVMRKHYVRKDGNYFVSIVISSLTGESTLSKIEKNFIK